MLDALDVHMDKEIERYEEMSVNVASLTQKIDALKGWVLAIGMGAAGVFAVFEILAKIGVIKGG
jgi:hypothetical protein